MKKPHIPSFLIIFMIVAGLSVAVSGARAQNAAQADTGKTAEQVFKNIQTLKGIPADQLQPSMQFISNALGVQCTFCHVQGAFEKDDKKAKLTARKMIEMQMAINKTHFEGHEVISCNSCHHGAESPAAIPSIPDEEPKHVEAVRGEGAALPTADQLIDKYVQAVGGADAVKKITSRVEKATISFGSEHFPVDVVAKAPNKRSTIVHTPNGENVTAYDGQGGWLGNPGRQPVRDMSAQDADIASLDAAFYLPVDMKTIFSQFFVRPTTDKIDGHDVYLLVGTRQGKPPVRFFFDKESGLLLRTMRFTETPLGRNPVEVNYADYRSEGGVKIPYQWTVARPLGRFTIQVNEVQQNVPVDDAKFQKPAVTEEKPAQK